MSWHPVTSRRRRLIIKSLLDLGDTEKEVADSLRAAGIRGVKGMAAYCPIAVYIRSQHLGPAEFAIAFPSEVTWKEGKRRQRVANPRPVRDFIVGFDFGRYPDLACTY
jgi:hypothetical protein